MKEKKRNVGVVLTFKPELTREEWQQAWIAISRLSGIDAYSPSSSYVSVFVSRGAQAEDVARAVLTVPGVIDATPVSSGWPESI